MFTDKREIVKCKLCKSQLRVNSAGICYDCTKKKSKIAELQEIIDKQNETISIFKEFLSLLKIDILKIKTNSQKIVDGFSELPELQKNEAEIREINRLADRVESNTKYVENHGVL